MTCANCHAEIPAGVAFCPQCGAAVGAAAPAGGPVVSPAPVVTTGNALAPNVAGALAYVTIIPAIIFLVIEPYNRDKFIRFHSFQCLFLALSIVVLEILLGVLGGVIGLGLGMGMLVWSLYRLFSLLVLLVVILCAVKAYQGKKLVLPVIGKISEQMADKV